MAPEGDVAVESTTQRRSDGRTLRAERTRAAIIDAHMALMLEGDPQPTARRVAERAGVSLRTLWGHFADLEALFAATWPAWMGARDDLGLSVDEATAVMHRTVTALPT